ncbi:OmpW/AlkL family protein [Variovorax sp. LT1R16]|uniref:OmpW/AlkL family protein n=1 Tax=Variovorax sp. LT1R16 TaxID=3443728 RepID=UPI003F4520C9
MKKKTMYAFAALAVLGSGSALAQNAGDWVLGAGWLHFAPQDSSKPLTFTSPINAVVPGSGSGVDSSNTLGLSAVYFIDSRWAVEGVFGVPPKFNLQGEGSLAPIGKLGEAKQWSPTLLAKYYFGNGNDAFRPFLGLGATYVWYSDVNLTPGLQGALGGRLGRPPGSTSTTAKLDKSFAPVFNLGAAWQFDKHWGLSFSVSYIPLKTTAKLTTRTAGGTTIATSEARMKLDPIVTYLSATYRF